MGWIIAFYLDESSTTPLGFWDGDSISLVADEPTVGYALASSFFYGESAGNTIVDIRRAEGTFQQQFTDYDVRLKAATQTITLV